MPASCAKFAGLQQNYARSDDGFGRHKCYFSAF